MNWTRSLRFWSNTVRKCIGEDCCGRTSLWPVHRIAPGYRHFGRRIQNDDSPLIDRSFLAKLWEADRKLEGSREKRKRHRIGNYDRNGNQNRIGGYDRRAFGKSTLDATFAEGKPWKQPPPSQSVSGFLEPHSPEEVSLDFKLYACALNLCFVFSSLVLISSLIVHWHSCLAHFIIWMI